MQFPRAIKIAILLWLSLTSPAAAAWPFDSVCEIQVKDGDSAWQGSGSLIATNGDKALVLTCRHVCPSEGMEVTVRWPIAGDQSGQGIVLAVVPGRTFETDLAAVICDRPKNVPALSLAKADLRHGPFVGAGWRAGSIRIIQSDSASFQDSMVVIPDPAVGGMSGGPLFNRRAQIIAVVVASDRATLTLSSDGAYLHNLVNQFRRKEK